MERNYRGEMLKEAFKDFYRNIKLNPPVDCSCDDYDTELKGLLGDCLESLVVYPLIVVGLVVDVGRVLFSPKQELVKYLPVQKSGKATYKTSISFS